jgi:hypothetical protein
MGWMTDGGGFFTAPFKSLTAEGAEFAEEDRKAFRFVVVVIAGD